MSTVQAYGVVLSADLALPAAFPGPPGLQEPGLSLTRDAHEAAPGPALERQTLTPMHGRQLFLLSDAGPTSVQKLPSRELHLEVADVVRFRVARPGEIRYQPLAQGAHAGDGPKIPFWFLHVFLPLYLAVFEGQLIFHGATVVKGGSAHVLLGGSRVGKSTLAQAFLEAGYRLYSDDKLRLLAGGGGWRVFPSHACFRPYRCDEDLGRRVTTGAGSPLPVRDVTILGARGTSDDIVVNPLRGANAVKQLLAHRVYDFRALRAEGLGALADLARHVRVMELARPDGLNYLQDTVKRLEASWSRAASRASA